MSIYEFRKFASAKIYRNAIDRGSAKLFPHEKYPLYGNSNINLNDQSNSLHHLFNQKLPTPEKVQDLLNFREIGQREFGSRVEYYILRNLSVKPPNHRKCLLTFTDRQKKVSDIEREQKLQIECWKKRVAFASSTGTHIMNAYQQCIELPRAIATSDGHPVKGTKANSTKVYEKRYEYASPPIIKTSIPPGWIPSTVIMEGMFLINITPWSAHKIMLTFYLNSIYFLTLEMVQLKCTYFLMIQSAWSKARRCLKDSTGIRQTQFQMITAAVISQKTQ